MAPSPTPQDAPIAPQADQQNVAPAKRLIAESTLISIIIPLIILSILTIALTSFFIRRAWTRRRDAQREKEQAEAPTPPPLAQRRQSNWARQNSNVLWSMYINDDDLRAQFSKPSKDSRMFSIGSVSTVGPLDTPAGRPSVVVEHDEKPAALNKVEEPTTKSAWEKLADIVPRRATCANVQVQGNDAAAGSGGLGRRKLSLTAV